MEINDYQSRAHATAGGECDTLMYLGLALCGEAGEVAEKIKKIVRDQNGKIYHTDVDAITLELGDVLWYLSVMAAKLGVSLEKVASLNLDKINKRLEHGTLHGSGDNR